MKVKSLTLKNYRNYKCETFNFSDGINILYGENAQGKTNVLEAINIFSSSRSHRGVRDRELVSFNENESELILEFFSQERNQISTLNIYSGKNKKLFINGIEQRYVKALLGVFSTVIFAPEDLNLIKEGPEGRRRFIDTDISQIRPNYYRILKEYKKINELKLNLLKKDVIDDSLLDVYNEKLSVLGAKLTVHRHRFLEEISDLTKKALKYISKSREEIEIIYKPGFDFSYSLSNKEIAQKLKKAFDDIKETEKLKRACLIGSLRDDILFMINKKDARLFASQGQQRSVITALKLAEFEFMREVLNEPPVLLLDDIFSELDKQRQEKLLKFLNKGQIIITCTDKDMLDKADYPATLIKIEDGSIKEQKKKG